MANTNRNRAGAGNNGTVNNSNNSHGDDNGGGGGGGSSSSSKNTSPPSSTRALLRSLPSLQGPYTHTDLIDRASFLPPTPQEAFGKWLADAVAVAQSEAGAQLPCEPHAMTVSTVDAEGRPDARVLILKNVDDRGWHFAAKAASPKGRQLAASSAAALTFYWSPLARQVRIRGQAVLLPPEECAADFLARPLASRISALASPQQSAVMVDRTGRAEEVLAESTRKAAELLAKQPDYAPESWQVYAVAPSEVEFWQGATDRQHHRLRYVWVGESEYSVVANGTNKGHWKTEHLWP